jgi:dihydrofolate reductase
VNCHLTETIRRDIMKLTVNTFLSVDGVLQGPGGPGEDTSGGFDRGGWLVPYADDDMGAIVTTWFEKADAFLLGRRTYEIFAGYWPNVTDPDDIVATKLNTLPKYVPSSTLSTGSWENTTVLSGDLADRVGELKARDGGELQVHGSGALARSLYEAGLIDELRLLVFPVCVGTGKRLFGDSEPPSGFTLADSRTTSAGAVYSVLTPTPFQTGEFGIDDGSEKQQ